MSVTPVGFNRQATTAECPHQLAAMGPTIGCWVGFDQTYDPKIPQKAAVIPTEIRYGLIDTGASHSSIDADLGKALGLPVIDKKPVSGVHGANDVEICMAQVHLPSVPFTIYGPFALVNLRAGGQNIDVLLGRTFLQHCIMIYDGVSGYCRIIR